MEWNCPDCKANNSEDITRCTCGYDIDMGFPPKFSTAESKIIVTKSHNVKLNTSLIGILLILLIIALIFMFAPSDRTNSLRETWLRINNNPAQKCLDNARKDLADPDSARVISFSFVQEESAHVLKYRAKNSYGAYVQGEYFCDSSGGPDNYSIERETKKIQEQIKELKKAKSRNP